MKRKKQHYWGMKKRIAFRSAAIAGGLTAGVGFGIATGAATGGAGMIAGTTVGVFSAQRFADRYMLKHHLFPKKKKTKPNRR